MIDYCIKSGTTCVMRQWGFDDEANHLLLQKKLPAVRWVGGIELELLALTTGGHIVPRFQELTVEKLGTCGSIRVIEQGTSKEKMLIIENCPYSNAVTIFVRGGNKMIVEEACRSIHDALCVVRNIIKDNRIIYGGGSSEISCSRYILEKSKRISGIEQFMYR